MDYSLNTPTNRTLYIPTADEQLKLKLPSYTSEQDQTHRNLQWLFHKPQNHAIFPEPPHAARFDKKK